MAAQEGLNIAAMIISLGAHSIPAARAFCLNGAPHRSALASSCRLWSFFSHGTPNDGTLVGPRHILAQPHSEQSSFASSATVLSSDTKNLIRRKPGGGVSGETTCPGCGVLLQDKNPDLPGFFQRPAWMEEVTYKLENGDRREEEGVDKKEEADGVPVVDDFEDDEEEGEAEESGHLREGEAKAGKGGDWQYVPSTDGLEEWMKGLQGIKPESYGFEARNCFGKRKKKLLEKKDVEQERERVMVCARCHSLRHYGKVKDENVENLLPDFDFDQTVGVRLRKASSTRAVVLMVVDSVDFDGSFPRRVASLLSQMEERERESWQNQKPGNIPRLVLVVNKIDLLPGQISHTRLEHWVRRRSKAGGATQLTGLFLVSALKGYGIEALVKNIKELAGPRGQVWVIGAQNAGKSSLINALGRLGVNKVTHLTEAPIPGTTLGIVRVDGILPAKAKLFDTPGLLHPHQITVRLNREEQKLVYVRKELKPRTYRVKVNDTIYVAGLARIDLKESSASSIYISVWVSAHLICHMGQTKKADENFQKFVGEKLKPPMNRERLGNLGCWTRTEVKVEGDTWDRSSVDVAVAGLGWFGLCLKGFAILDVWTYNGVAITIRDALVYDMASKFEKCGFTSAKGGTSKKINSKKMNETTDYVNN